MSKLNQLRDTIWIGLDFPGFLEAKVAKLGQTFFMSMPGLHNVLVTSNPDNIKAIFQADPEQLSSSVPSPLDPLLGQHSLILLQQNDHTQERKMLKPMFQGHCLRAYGEVMQSTAIKVINEFSAEIDAQKRMQEIAMRIIIRVVFGITDETRQQQYRVQIDALQRSYSPAIMLVPALRRPLAGLGPWDRFVQQRDAFDQLLLEDIAKAKVCREQQEAQHCASDIPNYDNVLSHLVNARDTQGRFLEDRHIRDELTTLLIAGNETTANVLSWALHFITINPDVYTKLHHEIDSITEQAIPSPGLAIDQVMKLPYLDAVCKEVMRLHPVVPLVLRSVMGPCNIGGFQVDKGDYVGIATPVVHRDNKSWQNPNQFCPERFLEKDGNTKKVSPFEFIPFGGGTKKCIGYGFSLFEMKIVLSEILHRFEISQIKPKSIKPSIQGITMGPNKKITISTSRRDAE